MAQKTDVIVGLIIGAGILFAAWDKLKPEPPLEPQVVIGCSCPDQDSSVTIGVGRLAVGDNVAEVLTCVCWKDNKVWGCDGPRCGEFSVDAWHPETRE